MKSLAGILSVALLVSQSVAGAAPAMGEKSRASRPAQAAEPYGDKGEKKPEKKPKVASCEVIEFLATKAGQKSIDPKLSKWQAELDQPPLSAFDTFKVTDAKTVVIAKDATANVKVTASVSLLFKGVATENDKDRLQLEVTIDNAQGKRSYRQTSTQDSGASQILTAGKHAESNVFFVITCTAQ